MFVGIRFLVFIIMCLVVKVVRVFFGVVWFVVGLGVMFVGVVEFVRWMFLCGVSVSSVGCVSVRR